MSALNRTPQNTNYLQPTKFILTFDKIPDTQYFCTTINIPGLNLGTAEMNTPFRTIPLAGSSVDYNPLNISFNLNGDLGSWFNLHEWMRSIGSPVGFEDRRLTTDGVGRRTPMMAYAEATLTIMNNLNNPIGRIQYYNIYPTSLSDIDFDTSESADNIMVGMASFNYEYYDYIRL